MDAGRTAEKVAQAGRGTVTWIWDVLSRTSGLLAVVMKFLGKRAERMAARFQGANGRLERFSRWSHAKAMRVPLGADLAEDWEEPEELPPAVTPPPIPPAAFFQPKRTPEEEDWGAAIEAAKHSTPEPSTSDEWEAALVAAKHGPATPAPVTTASVATTIQPAPVEVPAAKLALVATKVASIAPKATPARSLRPAASPGRRTAELSSAAHLGALKNGAALSSSSDTGPKPLAASDAQTAAATRKAVAAALRP
jgi:hypothetical protein